MTDTDAPLAIGSPGGVRAAIHPFGARIASLSVPGRDGPLETVLDHATPRPPPDDKNYLGNTVGRVSGRIAKSCFVLDGATCRLDPNEGANHLHGGPGGFHARSWTVLDHQPDGANPQVVLALRSPAGEGGYPGTLDVTAHFRIVADGLSVELTGRCDLATPAALTLHPYFNLSGDHRRDIGTHRLALNAGHYLELDPEFIPTGRLLPVDGTCFDFRTPRLIGNCAPDSPALRATGGYDHTWVCDPRATWHARLEHPETSIAMEVRSNQPSVQFYAGQYLRARPGVAWRERCGLCLEPQAFPNAINEPAFPPVVLRPGDTYRNLIDYRFRQDRA
ncbi:MAG: galactose mutarotase [Proteobacteria bacterium]|nr:MAG: galactose mutarotase [Pseudomonadota bacterium]